MKKLINIFLIIALGLNLFAQDLNIPKRPFPARLVNVLTQENFLTDKEVNELERKLVAFDDSTSNQIAIVIVDDIKGMSANEFATEIGYQWGIGQQKKDNGIVVLLSVGGPVGSRHYYIAVGYGLEGAIPDLAVKRIQERELLPYLKSGEYYRALDRTTTVLMELANGEYNSEDYIAKSADRTGLILTALILFGMILIIIFGMKGGRERGGGYVGGAGGFRPFGGGSSSGGGFGGFGGGSFGGGGAGGRW